MEGKKGSENEGKKRQRGRGDDSKGDEWRETDNR